MQKNFGLLFYINIVIIMSWIIRIVSREAQKEVEALPKDLKARFLQISGLIEIFGPLEIKLPYIKFLGAKLWEIKLTGKTTIARSVFVMLSGKEILILNTFIKKTQQTPLHELRLAQERLKRWKNGRKNT
ncbi:MAG: type II toxin-antitoxin system RelE/ParE family toxin [Alphaproteobacteria bacterium]|nr:type II toxin-antitoxin system RelE/ParE family toxin [Alphaproteobacteria bacterium]